MEGELQNIHQERVSILANLVSTQELCIKLDEGKELLSQQLTSTSEKVERVCEINLKNNFMLMLYFKGSQTTFGSRMIKEISADNQGLFFFFMFNLAYLRNILLGAWILRTVYTTTALQNLTLSTEKSGCNITNCFLDRCLAFHIQPFSRQNSEKSLLAKKLDMDIKMPDSFRK